MDQLQQQATPAWYSVGPSQTNKPAVTCQDMDRRPLKVSSCTWHRGISSGSFGVLCPPHILCSVYGPVASYECSIGFGIWGAWRPWSKSWVLCHVPPVIG